MSPAARPNGSNTPQSEIDTIARDIWRCTFEDAARYGIPPEKELARRLQMVCGLRDPKIPCGNEAALAAISRNRVSLVAVKSGDYGEGLRSAGRSGNSGSSNNSRRPRSRR